MNVTEDWFVDSESNVEYVELTSESNLQSREKSAKFVDELPLKVAIFKDIQLKWADHSYSQVAVD